MKALSLLSCLTLTVKRSEMPRGAEGSFSRATSETNTCSAFPQRRQTLEICSLLHVLMLQHLWDFGCVLSCIPKYKQEKHKLGKGGRYIIGWKAVNKLFRVQKPYRVMLKQLGMVSVLQSRNTNWADTKKWCSYKKTNLIHMYRSRRFSKNCFWSYQYQECLIWRRSMPAGAL